MKDFRKLALAAAVSALPVSGFAMESMDDGALSEVTGQDGIAISLGTDIAADIIIHDTDGFTNATNSGAIILQGFNQSLGGGTVDIDIDAGNDGTNGTALQIAVTLPATMTVALGNVQVADSNRTTGGGTWGTTGAATTVMTLGTLSLGATSLNIQLGHEYQGNMIDMSTTITNGISLSNFSISDAGGSITGGDIFMSNLTILDNGGTDLTVDQSIDVDDTDLVITVNQMGNATTGADIRITDLRLGSAANGSILGDVEIQALDLTGTIRIGGK